jgi:antitoxin ParD1/3/4
MIHVTLSLPADVESAVAERVRRGGYASLAEYLEEMLVWDVAVDDEPLQMTPELQALLEEGERSGVSERSLDEIFADARQQYAAGS